MCLLLLGGELNRKGIPWIKPGAVHHARWMPTILYCAKIFAFKYQIGYSEKNNQDIEKICSFICLYYIKPWLLTAFASEAPILDLKLMEHLNKDIQMQEIANKVIKCLQNQAWYLTEELVPLCLFGDNTLI